MVSPDGRSELFGVKPTMKRFETRLLALKEGSPMAQAGVQSGAVLLKLGFSAADAVHRKAADARKFLAAAEAAGRTVYIVFRNPTRGRPQKYSEEQRKANDRLRNATTEKINGARKRTATKESKDKSRERSSQDKHMSKARQRAASKENQNKSAERSRRRRENRSDELRPSERERIRCLRSAMTPSQKSAYQERDRRAKRRSRAEQPRRYTTQPPIAGHIRTSTDTVEHSDTGVILRPDTHRSGLTFERIIADLSYQVGSPIGLFVWPALLGY